MSTTPHAPRLPLEARRNRVYDADGREVLVATRSEPSLRGRADLTAAEAAIAVNTHDDAIALARMILENAGLGGDPDTVTEKAARAFLAKAGA